MQLDPSIRAVLARFNVDQREVTPITSGHINDHWRVEAADDAVFVLRRYIAVRSAAAIGVEHEVLMRLAERQWPVAAPIDAGNGNRIVEHDARLYALFPFIRGELGAAHSRGHLRVRGRLLARLHGELATLPVDNQRDGFSRTWELDTPDATFDGVLRAFGAEHRELASAIRGERYRNLRELSRLGYGPLPQQLVHGDFSRDNLLFDSGELAAVLDFDFVHLDARVADIAWSVLSDWPPADTAIDPAAAAAFVGGYLEHTQLSETELRLIVPLLRAHQLAMLGFGVRAWAARDRSRALMVRIERRTRQRLPQLAQQAAAIEEALLREADRCGPT